MDQLNRVAVDDGGTDSASKVTEEGKGVKDNVDVASDGSPRRFYHTVRVCSVTIAICYCKTPPNTESLDSHRSSQADSTRRALKRRSVQWWAPRLKNRVKN